METIQLRKIRKHKSYEKSPRVIWNSTKRGNVKSIKLIDKKIKQKISLEHAFSTLRKDINICIQETQKSKTQRRYLKQQKKSNLLLKSRGLTVTRFVK